MSSLERKVPALGIAACIQRFHAFRRIHCHRKRTFACVLHFALRFFVGSVAVYLRLQARLSLFRVSPRASLVRVTSSLSIWQFSYEAHSLHLVCFPRTFVFAFSSQPCAVSVCALSLSRGERMEDEAEDKGSRAPPILKCRCTQSASI